MRKIIPAVLAVAAAASLGGTVLAHAYSAPSTTSLRYDEDGGEFRGRVASPRRSCEDSRKIKLVKHTSSGNDVVGRTRSNSKGRWSIEKENASGAYSAIVVRRDRTPPGHVHACQRGTSGTVTVDP
ncbi:MAG TPA: hypothetical protein VG318_16385 [Actinomycetota bacterium]|nr:hypothetical protein [Actinomycetota bacterium]